MCHALQGPVVMGAFQRREAEKYGSIHQEARPERKRCRNRELGVGGLPRTFKRAVRGG